MAQRLHHVMQVRLSDLDRAVIEHVSQQRDVTLGGAVRSLIQDWLARPEGAEWLEAQELAELRHESEGLAVAALERDDLTAEQRAALESVVERVRELQGGQTS